VKRRVGKPGARRGRILRVLVGVFGGLGKAIRAGTHALEINPKPVINSGARPTTSRTSAMM